MSGTARGGRTRRLLQLGEQGTASGDSLKILNVTRFSGRRKQRNVEE
jgi:hypothetical protein